jgi:hypothetical protein
MRYLVVLIGAAFLLATLPSMAAAPSSQDDVIKRTQEAFRKAKTPKDIASIKAYCEDSLATFSFPERNKLMVQAIKLMEADKLDEANVLKKRVNSIEELDETLAKMVCKPK